MQIEKDIPFPDNPKAHRKRVNYPFDKMEEGDSFFVPFTVADVSTVQTAVSKRASRHGETYLTQQVTGGTRVWLCHQHKDAVFVPKIEKRKEPRHG